MKTKSILIVDDDQSILESIRLILHVGGYHVDTAKTGREAMEKFEKNSYDLALLDLKLPDMDGTDLLVMMSDSPKQTVKIMITGYPALSNAIKSLYLGAHAYILKPVKPDELLNVIKDKLERQKTIKKFQYEDIMIMLEKFLDLIDDEKLWTIDEIADELNISQYLVEKATQFFARCGLIKYWSIKGSVKLNTDSLKIPAMT